MARMGVMAPGGGMAPAAGAARGLTRNGSAPGLLQAQTAEVQLKNRLLREEVRMMYDAIRNQSSELSQLWAEAKTLQRSGSSGSIGAGSLGNASFGAASFGAPSFGVPAAAAGLGAQPGMLGLPCNGCGGGGLYGGLAGAGALRGGAAGAGCPAAVGQPPCAVEGYARQLAGGGLGFGTASSSTASLARAADLSWQLPEGLGGGLGAGRHFSSATSLMSLLDGGGCRGAAGAGRLPLFSPMIHSASQSSLHHSRFTAAAESAPASVADPFAWAQAVEEPCEPAGAALPTPQPRTPGSACGSAQLPGRSGGHGSGTHGTVGTQTANGALTPASSPAAAGLRHAAAGGTSSGCSPSPLDLRGTARCDSGVQVSPSAWAAPPAPLLTDRSAGPEAVPRRPSGLEAVEPLHEHPAEDFSESASEVASAQLAPGLPAAPGCVSLWMKVENVSLSRLQERRELLEDMQSALKEVIAFEAGTGVAPEDVHLRFSPGSVVVHATVRPPAGASVGAVQSRLSSSPSLGVLVVSRVANLRGISEVATGAVGVSALVVSVALPVEAEVFTTAELDAAPVTPGMSATAARSSPAGSYSVTPSAALARAATTARSSPTSSFALAGGQSPALSAAAAGARSAPADSLGGTQVHQPAALGAVATARGSPGRSCAGTPSATLARAVTSFRSSPSGSLAGVQSAALAGAGAHSPPADSLAGTQSAALAMSAAVPRGSPAASYAGTSSLALGTAAAAAATRSSPLGSCAGTNLAALRASASAEVAPLVSPVSSCAGTGSGALGAFAAAAAQSTPVGSGAGTNSVPPGTPAAAAGRASPVGSVAGGIPWPGALLRPRDVVTQEPAADPPPHLPHGQAAARSPSPPGAPAHIVPPRGSAAARQPPRGAPQASGPWSGPGPGAEGARAAVRGSRIVHQGLHTQRGLPGQQRHGQQVGQQAHQQRGALQDRRDYEPGGYHDDEDWHAFEPGYHDLEEEHHRGHQHHHHHVPSSTSRAPAWGARPRPPQLQRTSSGSTAQEARHTPLGVARERSYTVLEMGLDDPADPLFPSGLRIPNRQEVARQLVAQEAAAAAASPPTAALASPGTGGRTASIQLGDSDYRRGTGSGDRRYPVALRDQNNMFTPTRNRGQSAGATRQPFSRYSIDDSDGNSDEELVFADPNAPSSRGSLAPARMMRRNTNKASADRHTVVHQAFEPAPRARRSTTQAQSPESAPRGSLQRSASPVDQRRVERVLSRQSDAEKQHVQRVTSAGTLGSKSPTGSPKAAGSPRAAGSPHTQPAGSNSPSPAKAAAAPESPGSNSSEASKDVSKKDSKKGGGKAAAADSDSGSSDASSKKAPPKRSSAGDISSDSDKEPPAKRPSAAAADSSDEEPAPRRPSGGAAAAAADSDSDDSEKGSGKGGGGAKAKASASKDDSDEDSDSGSSGDDSKKSAPKPKAKAAAAGEDSDSS